MPGAPSIEAFLNGLERDARLDGASASLSKAVERALPTGPLRDVLHGVWLGHPLHPMLTDLPIGAWTSAWTLDLIGGRRGARAAQTLVGFGCLTAVPTIASGLADWSRLDDPEQRVGLVHAVANSVALALYTWSWTERRRGRRMRGVVLGMAGASAATAGGFLGGHLAFRRAVGANRTAGVQPSGDWTPGAVVADGRVVQVGDDEVLFAPDLGSGISARCSHANGPLADGELSGSGRDRCVVCPWHGSTFRLADGSVVHGPATSPQPAYEVRRSGDGWEARARTAGSRSAGD